MTKLSWAGEVFYRRLHSVVDDYGRYYGTPMLLRAACYPLQLDKVSDSDIGKWIRETVEAALVRVYEVAGRQYVELLDFRQQVRAKASKFPHPPDDAEQTRNTCVADAEHVHTKTYSESKSNSESESKASTRSRKTPIPADFLVSERVRSWAKGKGFDNLEGHLEHFVGKAKAKGYTYVDWDEGFMGAIRDDWAGIRKVGNSGNKQVALEERNRRVAEEAAKEFANGNL